MSPCRVLKTLIEIAEIQNNLDEPERLKELQTELLEKQLSKSDSQFARDLVERHNQLKAPAESCYGTARNSDALASVVRKSVQPMRRK